MWQSFWMKFLTFDCWKFREFDVPILSKCLRRCIRCKSGGGYLLLRQNELSICRRWYWAIRRSEVSDKVLLLEARRCCLHFVDSRSILHYSYLNFKVILSPILSLLRNQLSWWDIPITAGSYHEVASWKTNRWGVRIFRSFTLIVVSFSCFVSPDWWWLNRYLLLQLRWTQRASKLLTYYILFEGPIRLALLLPYILRLDIW